MMFFVFVDIMNEWMKMCPSIKQSGTTAQCALLTRHKTCSSSWVDPLLLHVEDFHPAISGVGWGGVE